MQIAYFQHQAVWARRKHRSIRLSGKNSGLGQGEFGVMQAMERRF
jgi:hypothetical protein